MSLDCGKVKSGGEGEVGVGGYDPAEGADDGLDQGSDQGSE